MELGKGIKEPAAEKLLAKAKQNLIEGEVVLFICKCNNFKPMVDRILLTNKRLLAVSAADAKVGFSADSDEVVDVVVESGWTGTTLAITKSNGNHTVFKSMEEVDAEALRKHLKAGTAGHQPPPATTSAEPDISGEKSAPLAPKQPGALARAGATMKRVYGDAQEASAQLAESNAAKYGSIVKRGQFGLKTVEIYDLGYVRVGTILTQKSPFEKLKSIRFSFQVQDRSGLGHMWASGGLGSREKRVLLLVIATDKQIHTLSTEGEVGRSEDKVGMALEAAGNNVLADVNRAPAPSVVSNTVPGGTAADRLRNITELHKEGLLSDEEFAAARARLVEEL